MEIKIEEFLRNGKKVSKGIIITYIVCAIVIIGAIIIMNYRQIKAKSKAIDFTEEGVVYSDEGQYACLPIEKLSMETAEHVNEDGNVDKKFYIAINGKYFYIVALNNLTSKKLSEIQEYTYNTSEDAIPPKPITVYGMTENITYELKNYILKYYNNGLDEKDQIKIEDFDMYFGKTLLNTTSQPIDISFEILAILFAIIALICAMPTHIKAILVTRKTSKYIKQNQYEDTIEYQLDKMIEESHYNDGVIITKDFIINKDNEGAKIVKFSDIKWIYIHTLKYNGIIIKSNLIAYLKDGKQKFELVNIKRAPNDELIGIYDVICKKVSSDCLLGYKKSNTKEYKQYKKELKN